MYDNLQPRPDILFYGTRIQFRLQAEVHKDKSGTSNGLRYAADGYTAVSYRRVSVHLNETSDIARVYEVDIEYLEHLHEDHNDFPFLPNNGVPPDSKVKKLMVNRLIVKKVHRVMQFNQLPWLKKYIYLNTDMRKKAANNFEKDFYKLMNNTIFSKRRINIELVSNEQRVQKLINRITFKYCTTYNENLCAISLENKIIISAILSILDLPYWTSQKIKMYDYHYNVMRKHFKDTISLLYTNTNSLVYHIKTKDFDLDLRSKPGLLECTDTVNRPKDHQCYVKERKKVPGLFSEESDGRTITEFCALRAKSYAYKINGVKKIKAKGIRGHVVKNHMTFNDHNKCLFGVRDLNVHRENVSIWWFLHQLKTIFTNKLAYNKYDDKRITMRDTHNGI
ncbi:DNA polymerase, palm domain [Cinara cedri]|uniref:DNA polymerase, palm domain n=1 Tax=Cinara cedri TaxID=506608 RepID=A0A5E4NKC6_9HEMI|nr:DNA polymerase, palm domain [Cinara cedri]